MGHFNTFMHGFQTRVIQIMNDISIRTRLIDNQFRIEFDNQTFPFKDEFVGNPANLIELLLFNRILREGPKVFCPSQYQLEMCEEVSVNIPFENYNQPFGTLIIELPPNYITARTIPHPQAGQDIYGVIQEDFHKPLFVIIHHDPISKCILTNVTYSSKLSIKNSYIMNPDTMMEKYMFEDFEYAAKQFAKSFDVSVEEKIVTNAIVRATVNYCLLIDEYGVKKIGPENPKYYERLQRQSKGSKYALKTHPIVYTIAQEVKLHGTVHNASDLPKHQSEEEMRSIGPHWRRGHYKMQPYGVGGLLRKRIRINPVFVNKHLFLGNMGDTSITYET